MSSIFDELLEPWREAYDPPKVSWQTDQLYRVEHARRALKAAKERAAADWAWHNRYEEEARQRAVALALAQLERAAYRASPEGLAEAARYEAERKEECEREHERDMKKRRYRLPAWAEWAAWRVAMKKQKETHRAIGENLGVSHSVIGRAVMDYVYLNHPDVNVEWRKNCPLDAGPRRAWLRKHFRDRPAPAFPGRVVRTEEPLPPNPRTREEYKRRNEWVYRQWLGGRTLQEIAQIVGRSRARVEQICCRQEEINCKRAEKWSMPKPWRAPVNNGRPVDMGGPREVWLTYYPPPDPRLDNMEPVRA